MARAGVHEATVTPHVGHPGFPLDVGTIPARTRALQAAIDAADIDLRLHPGGEIFPERRRGARSRRARRHRPRAARRALGAARGAVRRHRRALPRGVPPRAGARLRAADRPPGAGARLAAGRPAAAAPGASRPARCCRSTSARCSAARAPRRSGRRRARARRPRLRARLRRPRRQPRAHARRGPAAARAAGASAQRSRQLTSANPRFLLAHGIPAGPHRDPAAWRPQHEQRIRAAIAAARASRGRS